MHAIAIALTLSLSLAPPEAVQPESPGEAPPEAVEPSEVEPLPDIVPEPEPEPEPTPETPEPTPEVEPTPEPEVAPEPPPPSVDEAQLSVTRDRLGCNGGKKCRNMSVAGIVVGSLGLISTGVGIGLLVKRDEVLPDNPIFVTSTHPPGLIAVTIGTAVVVTAALMFGAAHKGYKPKPGKAARVQLGPTGLRF